MTPRIAVVGAGPAGLAAATAAARLGAQVSVYDEQTELGGQLRYRVQPVIPGPGYAAERPRHLAERLTGEAIAAGATIESSALAAGCFSPRDLLVVRADGAQRISPDVVILATGSTDLPFPFAGATLPGVFSARGLQILLNTHRVRPGRRFAIIGGDDSAEELVGDVMLAGGEVVWSGIAPASFLRAEGVGGVRALIVGQGRFAVDVVAIAVGRRADPALAAGAGVPLVGASALGGPVPVVDDTMETPIAGVFVAGDAAGIGSVAAVMAEGRLAGVAAAASLGLVSGTMVGELRAASGDELTWRRAMRSSREIIAVQPYEWAWRS